MHNKPHYELKSVFEDGTEGPAEIIPVASRPWDVADSRRSFFGKTLAVGLALAAMTAAEAGAASKKKKKKRKPHHSHGHTYTYCKCNKICVCNTICTCQAV